MASCASCRINCNGRFRITLPLLSRIGKKIGSVEKRLDPSIELAGLYCQVAAIGTGRRVTIRVGWLGTRQGQLLVDNQPLDPTQVRSEEHTSELQSLMRISYAVFCLQQTK